MMQRVVRHHHVAIRRHLFSTSRLIHGEDEMERFGAALASQIPSTQSGNVLLLHGDLGCGKTCFARGFARTWCSDASMDVTSPTYLLINTYNPPSTSKRSTLHHMDLYRLDRVTSTDAEALGLEDAFTNGTSIVEWPDRLQELPTPRLDVHITYTDVEGEREVHVAAHGGKWERVQAWFHADS
ncbi:YjeE family ATPase [Aphanomyces invadans]|uniref:tRNA threonylcarbamoyladenosine biosynthesis protein TsaE n=1 Tax=Aphanomyces invadans TaxID=157072 RepID=A0A024TFT1_9STRA|nr:YjeE family ATPase [Aphanomyces invadans]ETV92864.1 YjeE family ATPase [Aphanomyces invadans]|eukprot:XP_008878385.1 YjeE family ATPase [Aphanomyces invadans]